jgi:hypothetical protein
MLLSVVDCWQTTERLEIYIMSNKLYKPGEISPGSGQVEIVGPRGGNAGGVERTVVKGEPFPPTPEKGQKYMPVDGTKNKSGF